MRLQTWPYGMGQRWSAALERKAISENDRMYSVAVGGHINWAKDGGTATEKGIRRGQVRKGCIMPLRRPMASAWLMHPNYQKMKILLHAMGMGSGKAAIS